ncbi:MAG: glycosyltransferase [Pseudomonadota bacterium]
MKATPSVSVVMNCYNSDRYLKEAIDSVYAQTFLDWEIIFWDNASTDHSAEIAKSYDDKLLYFLGDQHVSLGAARNLALKQCHGKYIAFLDCDDLWLPTKLEKQVALLEQNPSLGMVYSDSYFFNERGNIRCLYHDKKTLCGNVFKELFANYFLDIETVIIVRSILDKLPEWFDPRLHVMEDADLFLRIAYDYPIDCVNEPLSRWRVHKNSDTFRRHELFAKESSLILDKLMAVDENFKDQFGEEIKSYRRHIIWLEALSLIRAGQSRQGRLLLRPYLLKSKSFFLLYCLSFLGQKLFCYLWNKRVGF